MSSSRRESRASLGSRQNDALFEFENFKKKFLLANKHITKLNSTLSVRIEELNAQISTLYVENLKLRASEIALEAQLKREREKSRKVMADAEAASLNLSKQLSYLRQTFNIGLTPATPPTPPSPRVTKRPQPPPPTSPTTQGTRIARTPNVPGIFEEEEPSSSSSDERDEAAKAVSPPHRKSKSKPRLSASKLPLPMRVTSPTPLPTPAPASTSTRIHLDLSVVSTGSKRKPMRRQSGLLTVKTDALSVPRAASPAFGSPIRLEAGRAEEEEEMAVDMEVTTDSSPPPEREKKRGKAKERDMAAESDRDAVVVDSNTTRRRERKRAREDDDVVAIPAEAIKFKLMDVTNSRTALQPIGHKVFEQADSDCAQSSNNRQFLEENGSPPSLPTPRASSSPTPASEVDAATTAAGREKRTRKSVNYAEPKLNTKMRKPDPIPGSSESTSSGSSRTAGKKRSSAAAVMAAYRPAADGNDADNDTEARSSLECARPPPLPLPSSSKTEAMLPLRAMNGGYINPELFPLPASRPGSAAAMYSPGPPPRAGGSTTASSSGSSTTSTGVSLRRKKSKPQIYFDSDDEVGESDGAEADGEYVPGGGSKRGGSSWVNVNVEGRKKSATKRSAGGGAKQDYVHAAHAQELDMRRHSMAV